MSVKAPLNFRLAVIFLVAVCLNFVWEMFAGLAYGRMHWMECLVASGMDGIMTLLIVAAGAGLTKNWNWTDNPKLRGYIFVAVLGFTMAYVTEIVAVHWLEYWSYKSSMPIIFGVGLLPLIQMILLPLVSFAIAKGLIEKCTKRAREL